MVDQLVDVGSAAPAPALAGLVSRYAGCRLEGFTPGEHLGLPSPHLEVIFALGEPLRHRGRSERSFAALAAGLQTGPAVIAHDGSAYTMSLALTPAGARALLGLPAAALAGVVVSLDDLLGRRAGELLDRLAAAPDWPSRFALLDHMLTSRARQPHRNAVLAYAWQRIVDADGTGAIGDLAAELGYSRQHLAKRFTAEFGLAPKQVARLARFARSRRLLQDAERAHRRHPASRRPTLAELAPRCGYYDQAHLAAEWKELAGCPPSVWLRAEELPFVQAAPGDPAEGSSP